MDLSEKIFLKIKTCSFKMFKNLSYEFGRWLS